MALTEQQVEYVLKNYKGCGPKEMAQRLDQPTKVVLAFYKNHKLNSGLTGRFEKGHTPWSKGKTPEQICKTPEALARSKATRFHKGHTPDNHVPVGTEVKKWDGYWWVKVGEPNKWKQKHRILYEKAHEKLKPDELITFLDGNKENLSLENMKVVTQRENLALTRGGFRHNGSEILATGVAIVKLDSAIHRREEQ